MTASLARVSLGTALGAAALIAVLPLVQPGFDPTWQFLSEHALAPAGWLMNLAFACLALSLWAFALVLSRQKPSGLVWVGLILAAISGVGMALGAVFNTDPHGVAEADRTVAGFWHLVGGQLNLTPFAALLVTLGRRKTLPRGPWLISLGLVVLVFVAVGLFVSSAAAGQFGPGSLTGLWGRLMLGTYLAWQVVVLVPLVQTEAARNKTNP